MVVAFQHIVPVHSLSEVHPQPVHVHLLDEECGAADELLAYVLVPETRGAAGRAVRQVAMIGRAVVRGASLVPVIDVVFRRGRIVLPFGSLGVVVVVIVDHVLNDRDAMPMAFAHKVPVLVATAGARFDAEVMGVAIAPAERAAEFRERQQFDRIHAELA